MSNEGLQVHKNKEGVETLTGSMDDLIALCDEDEREAVRDVFNEWLLEIDEAVFNGVFTGQVPLIWKHKNQYAVASDAIYEYRKDLIKATKQTTVQNGKIRSFSFDDDKETVLTDFYANYGLLEQNLDMRTRQKRKSSVKGVIIKRHEVENAFPCASRN
jgi:hypothetical protein